MWFHRHQLKWRLLTASLNENVEKVQVILKDKPHVKYPSIQHSQSIVSAAIFNFLYKVYELTEEKKKTKMSWWEEMLVKFQAHPNIFVKLLHEMKHRFTNLLHKLKDHLQFLCLEKKNRQQKSSGWWASANKWWSHFVSVPLQERKTYYPLVYSDICLPDVIKS